MNFEQFLLILRARLWLVFGVLVVVVATTATVSLLLPKQYAATASVVVDAKGIDMLSGMQMQAMLMPSYMATQVDIINSDRVAQRVIGLLKLNEVSQFREQWREETQGRGSFDKWLIDMLIKRLDVKPSRESNVINIGFSWPDPRTAAQFANAFAQAYIDTNLELRVEPARQYATFFAERTKVIREEIEAAQRRLSDFQRENGITAADERLDIETARLNELSSQLVAVQGARVDSQSRQRQAANRDTMPEVLQSSLISGLKAELAKLEARREELTNRLGRNHPEYQRTESEIGSLRDRIDQETRKVVSSLGANTQVNLQRESEIRASLDAQRERVLQLKNQRDELTVLQNDVANAQRTYDALSQRLTQTSLESEIQQTNISLLNAATEPLRHASPKLLLNLVVAIFLGTLLGVGTALMLELLDKRIRGTQDLQIVLGGIPVLGVIQDAGAVFRPRRGLRRLLGAR
ncbi:MAG: chain length determinant protein EpsF [Candidatus Dactylopiibacterium carminicum]|uniref:Chain length determinant protein EpsF n=1 Tax=Candidatus Dactylopiibacterium carminicum TaxID=857335 RepID=A0A272EP92_9RHOO|nr:chain length determinant protein EpsF [Candidatus Dactylopiibacterium carminicum]KAF7598256.1 chain length determinant protein EpsF [Candidatus Dactylopiibacterium carminicum]PAS91945.1 MAG: chain length determinant protein EpsF [Candidatus Dactylopiibacterium carminicum]PAS97139.1 MAG: chain length determinant protein EpsF [Candidatus Dactylopiibacterium carminicum]